MLISPENVYNILKLGDQGAYFLVHVTHLDFTTLTGLIYTGPRLPVKIGAEMTQILQITTIFVTLRQNYIKN